MLSWLAGMRVAEIAALTVGDVRNADGGVKERIQLRANQTKGSDSRTVLLNAHLQAELGAYLGWLKEPLVEGQPLFVTRHGKHFSPNSLCQRFIAIYAAAGVSAATSHSGRRTFIRRWWVQEADGTTYVTVRYGNRPIELEKSKPVIKVGKLEEVPNVLRMVIEAVNAGELDQHLNAAAEERRPKQ